MHWHTDFAVALHAIHVFFVFVGLALVPVVLVRRKEPASTAAWILTLVFLPAIGAVLFLMFGRDRIRWPAKRKRELDQIVRQRLAGSTAKPEPAGTLPTVEPLSSLERSLFRVGERLSHARATDGNKVEVLIDGDATYDAFGAAIDSARHHVHAQFYLIRDDSTGRWFRERLVAAAKRGVAVRLLTDGYGCFTLGPAWRRPLVQAGGRVASFLPMSSVLLQPVNLRNHRKILVVDGDVAFTGGYNIGDEYRGKMPGVGEWRDVHLRIEGPAAGELQRVFFQDWEFSSRESIDPKDYFPAARERRGDATVAIIPSGPDTRNEAIHRMFFGAIVGGQREISITTPYFVPTESILVAMELAAMRGVDIKVILPGRSNHAVTFQAGRSSYSQLLDAGVDIREYEPGIIHAKTMVVDSQVALVGSANMDLRSFRLNFEVHAMVHDASSAEALRESFSRSLTKCRRIDAEQWQRRPFTLRMKEGASRLVSPLL
jgi:cardiolipin synthase A/B